MGNQPILSALSPRANATFYHCHNQNLIELTILLSFHSFLFDLVSISIFGIDLRLIGNQQQQAT